MTLDEILEKYFASSSDDWSHVAAPLVPETSAHEFLLVYKPDVSIVLAETHDESDRDYVWDWVEIYPDKSARKFYIDLYYNGVPVHREVAVSVDGGRVQLPSPRGFVGEDKASGWKVDKDEHAFVRHYAVIRDRVREFDSYFEQAEQQAGLKIV